jgi:UDP-N-acetylglucosamine/UDP-N-acetylgalactosamine diphosphorylase
MTDLPAHLAAIGQAHVLEYMPSLPPDDQVALMKQLAALPLDRVADIFQVAMATSAIAKTAKIDPPPTTAISSRNTDPRVPAWKSSGLKLIHDGKCAVCILAGGQATRLGVQYPKGMLVLPELQSGKSLFQLQAEKVLKMQSMAGCVNKKIPFVLMTSEATYPDVMEYFKMNSYLGLSESQVFFFKQGTLPCLTEEAKMILETKSSVASAPNGNGGIYEALESSGTLKSLQGLGVQYLQVFSVDNPLARIADPVFYGMCDIENYDAAAKCTPKVSPQEAVGVFSLRNGKWGVTEYSEIGADRASEIEPSTGLLKFNAANLAIHCYKVSFLEICAKAMDQRDAVYHVARKEIPCSLTPTGKIRAIKMEAFIFDAFALTDKFGVMEVIREDEFSAVKNAEGSASDTPTTARKAYGALHRKWLQAAGAVIEGDGYVEISPLITYEGEGLETYAGVTIKTPAYLSSSKL